MVRKVNVTVVAQPEVIDRGQMLQISGSVISTKDGSNVVASRIFLQIVDSQGKEIWPVSVITKNDSQFTKLISTSELKPNTRYTIRVAINPKMIYQGFTTFKISQSPPILALAPILAAPAVLIPPGVQDHKFLIYRTELDQRVCPICLPHEGKIFPKGSKDIIRIGPPDLGGDTHYNCIIGSTIIDNPEGLVSALRCWYNGPVIELVISGNRSITVTPNHMFLTPQGFASANLLREGDDILYCTNTKRTSSFINPDNDRCPTTIKDVFDSLCKSFSMKTMSMPTTPKDLHGDSRFTKGNIDIVRPKCLLWNYIIKTFVFEHFDKLSFIKRFYNSFILKGNSQLASMLKVLLLPSDRIMSSFRKSDSFFLRRLGHSNKHCITSSSRNNSNTLQSLVNQSSTNSELISNCLNRHGSIIQTQKIISIKIKPFTGYVYDLQTLSTLYIGNGMILSNCRCHYDLIGVPFNAAVQKAKKPFTIMKIIQSIQKHKRNKIRG